MPVIRNRTQPTALSAERRRELVEQLARELTGQPIPQGPVIFEIPLEASDRIDVLVVWEAWGKISSTDRSDIILEVYRQDPREIAQALGLTYPEAIENQVLPYAVVPMVRSGEGSSEAIRQAMIDAGGFCLGGGKVDLRFPTWSFAAEAHRHLTDTLPQGYWSIVQTVGPIP